MKFLLIAFALMGIAAAALLDSATQGPNPQDIATPEPEYIDIDEPEPPKSAPVPQRTFSAPRPIQRPAHQSSFLASIVQQYQPRQVAQPAYSAPIAQYYQQPQQYSQQFEGHSYNSQSGYQYRRPVYIRRTYRRRY